MNKLVQGALACGLAAETLLSACSSSAPPPPHKPEAVRCLLSYKPAHAAKIAMSATDVRVIPHLQRNRTGDTLGLQLEVYYTENSAQQPANQHYKYAHFGPQIVHLATLPADIEAKAVDRRTSHAYSCIGIVINATY